MEEHWLWYLAGTVDTSATLTVKVQKDDRIDLGYKLFPRFYFARPKSVESIFGMVDEYLEDTTASYRIKELDRSNRLEIQNPEDIRTFIEPLLDGFIQQRDRAEYYLDEVLPLLENGSPKSEKKFIEAMEIIDGLSQYPIQPRTTSKYDADYFRGEWGL
ncbi:hypothetical protein [Halorubrum sp. SD683]|uniref:hypothetical protein n=1 Tax=Halorubrum sp. SD683 TaxID=1855873 RepID=UPI00117BC8B2|nr:hypothetical protein [Halorubrum sp. SD683]